MPSKVWEYFTVLPDQAKVRCSLCLAQVCRGGSSSRSWSTSNLRKHLQSKQEAQFKALCGKESVASALSKENPCSSSGSRSPALPIVQAFKRKCPWPEDHPKKENLTRSLCKMICVDMQPYSRMEIASFHCSAHLLNLVVVNSLKKEEYIINLLINVRKVCGHFHHSCLATTNLKNIQKNIGGYPEEGLKVLSDNNTRWNSTYLMLKRLHELKSAIVQFSCEHQLPFEFLQKHWVIIAGLLEILKPFYEATLQFSKDKSFISEKLPTLLAVKCKLDKVIFNCDRDEANCLISLREKLNEGLQERINKLDKQIYGLTCLDPRFKDRAFPTLLDKHNARKVLSSIYKKMRLNPGDAKILSKDVLSDDLSSSSSEEDGSGTMNDAAVENSGNSLWDSLMLESSNEGGELQNYLRASLLKSGEDILSFWNRSQEIYPVLASAARMVHSIPAASVPCERLFSVSGKIVTPSRNKIKPGNVNMLVMLRHNI